MLRAPQNHIGAVYELTGPAALDIEGLAEQYAKALDRPITAVRLPYDEWLEHLTQAGVEPHTQQHIATMARLRRDDRYNRLTHDVEDLTGRPAQSVPEIHLAAGVAGDIPLLESDQQAPIAPWQSRSEVVSELTRREYEVLQLMTKGATNREIATTIFLSEETVKSHVKRILQKFGVANRGQAVATYLESLDRRPGLSGGPRRGGVGGTG